jgi:hypothetical protein
MNTLEFCQKYLKKYTIKNDGSIDVNGDVDLYKKLGDMKKLPVKFGKVYGDYYCSWNKLTSLEGSPKHVIGDFGCRRINLSTLEGCSEYVGGDFWCKILTHHVLGNVQGEIYYNKQRIVI